MTKPFENWNDFIGRFLRDFEPAYEREKVMEMIKSRYQRQDESIVKYFIAMEDLFLRLPHVPSDVERIRIIRNNLLPLYINALALHHFERIDDLKEACKKIEAANIKLKERHSSNFASPSNPRNFSRPNQFPNRPNYNPGRNNYANYRPNFPQNRQFNTRQPNPNYPNQQSFERRGFHQNPRLNYIEVPSFLQPTNSNNPQSVSNYDNFQRDSHYSQYCNYYSNQFTPNRTELNSIVQAQNQIPSTPFSQSSSETQPSGNIQRAAVQGPTPVQNREGPNPANQPQ